MYIYNLPTGSAYNHQDCIEAAGQKRNNASMIHSDILYVTVSFHYCETNIVLFDRCSYTVRACSQYDALSKMNWHFIFNQYTYVI